MDRNRDRDRNQDRDRNLINTKKAARIMGVSKRTVQQLCKDGVLEGVQQKYEGGPYRIPQMSAEDWARRNRQERIFGRIRRSAAYVAFTTLATVFLYVAAYISAFGDIPNIPKTVNLMKQYDIIPAFEEAVNDQTLVIVFTYYRTEGIKDTDIHNRIVERIEEIARIEGLVSPTFRVENHPREIPKDDRELAEKISKRYNASIAVWGSDTGTQVRTYVAGVTEPWCGCAGYEIIEDEIGQIINGPKYAEFVNDDLPNQIAFLSMYIVAMSLDLRGDTTGAISLVENSINNILARGESLRGLDVAYASLGRLYQTAGDVSTARNYYEKALEENNNCHIAYFYIGYLLDSEEDTSGALANYEKASASPNESIRGSALNNRAMINLSLGEVDAAISDLSEAKSLHLEDPRILHNLGLAYYINGDPDQAMDEYSAAIDLDDDFIPAYVNRGNIKDNQGDFDEAILDYKEALKINPLSYSTNLNLGIAYSTNGDLEKAIATLTLAANEFHLDVDAHYWLALAKTAMNDFEGAISDYSSAIENLTKSDQIYLPEEASVGFRDTPISLEDLYYQKGMLERTYGRLIHADHLLKQAVDDYSAVIALNPRHLPAYNGLANALLDLKDYEGAIVNYDLAITIYEEVINTLESDLFSSPEYLPSPGRDHVRPKIFIPEHSILYSNRGKAKYYSNDIQGALDDFEQARYLNWNDSDAHWGMGMTLMELGDCENAIISFERYLDLVPDAFDKEIIEQYIRELEVCMDEN